MTAVGLQDVPLETLEQDYLGMTRYAKALAGFIRHCKTPMSIGIQGDWGLGKTSLMKLIQVELDSLPRGEPNRAHCLWVNTWQLSQFDLGNELPTVVMRSIIEKLSLSDQQKRSVLQRLRAVAQGAGRLAAQVIKKKTGADLGELVATHEDSGDDPATALEGLRNDFGEVCRQRCDGPDDRVVIFVDDLDRLIPSRAVELMEVIKNFLDVPNAVFVLAIDYQVVVKGLEAKFNLGIKDLGGRSFFDKIIQVPFRMPSQAYEIRQYLSQVLSEVDFPVEAPIDDYVELLGSSIGFNPRSIKRLCNNLLLLRLVIENAESDDQRAIIGDAYRCKILFATLCMEWAHRPMYDYLRKDVSAERLGQFRSAEEIDGLLASKALGEPKELHEQLPVFAQRFYRILDKDSSGDLDENELRALDDVLRVTAITSLTLPAPRLEISDASRHVNSFVRRVGDRSPKVQEAINSLLEIAQRRSGFSFHLLRKEEAIAARCGGDSSFWLVAREREPEVLHVFFNSDGTDVVGEDDPEECNIRGKTYLEMFSLLGFVRSEHGRGVGSKDWEGYLHISFRPATETAKMELARKLVHWWCIGCYETPR